MFWEKNNALKTDNRHLFSLVSNFPGMAWRSHVTYRDGEFHFSADFISEGCFELTGYKPDELMGDNGIDYTDLILPDNEGKRSDVVENIDALKDNRVSRAAYRIKTRSGEIKWVYEQGVGIYSDAGDPIGIEGYVTDFTELKQSEMALRKENLQLRASIKERYKFGDIIGKSAAMQDVYELILKAAFTDANVVIYGETGTGKELVARAIHNMSECAKNKFVPINCGAIPENLVESEFFGFKKGAFTGAHVDKSGYLERANGGTLFLDEVGDIGFKLQTKLLRALEDKSYMPVGGNRLNKSNFRLICATHKNLYELVKAGLMREDFYYRICVISIKLPALRDRKEDIPILVDHMFEKNGSGSIINKMSGQQMNLLLDYDWPGNIRELQNVIKRFLVNNTLELLQHTAFSQKNQLEIPKHAESEQEVPGIEEALARYEKEIITQAMEKVRWNKTKAASLLGIHRKTLFRRMKRLGL